MTFAFYLAAAVAVIATALMITNRNAVHALLYLMVSFMATAVIFFVVGAPFVAALEVIVYAGAIIVFFVFTIMMLGISSPAVGLGKSKLTAILWRRGPVILAAALVGELGYLILGADQHPLATGIVPPKSVGIALFSRYLVGVELASALLLAGLIGGYHLGRREPPDRREGKS